MKKDSFLSLNYRGSKTLVNVEEILDIVPFVTYSKEKKPVDAMMIVFKNGDLWVEALNQDIVDTFNNSKKVKVIEKS